MKLIAPNNSCTTEVSYAVAHILLALSKLCMSGWGYPKHNVWIYVYWYVILLHIFSYSPTIFFRWKWLKKQIW